MELQDDYAAAELDRVRPCPARSDYLELCFSTADGPVSWCFPKPAARRRRARKNGPVILRVGPYGLQPHLIRDGELTSALTAAETVPVNGRCWPTVAC
jgi:hypothetical protein